MLKRYFIKLIKLVVQLIPGFDANDDIFISTLANAIIVLTLRIFGAASGFVMSFLLAKQLGARGIGLYYQAMTVITILVAISKLGFGDVILRFGTIFASENNWSKYTGLAFKAINFTAIAAAISCVFIFISADWIAESVFSEPDLANYLRLASLAIIPVSVASVYSVLVRAMDHIELSMLGATISPTLMIVLFLSLIPILGVQGAILSYILSSLIIFVVLLLVWKQLMRGRQTRPEEFSTNLLFSVASPLLLIVMTDLLTERAAILLLGIWVDSSEVGIFGVAQRVASITTYALVAFNIVIPPRFAVLFAQKKFEQLARLVSNTTWLMTAIGLLVCLPMIFFPRFILQIFGTEFEQGALTLVIIASGQFVNVATGSVGNLLVMSGFEKLVRNNIVFHSLLSLVISIILIPQYGIVGSAIAISLAITSRNLTSAYLAYRYLGINIWSRQYAK